MSSKHEYAAVLSLVVGCGVGALAGCTGGAADPPTSLSTSVSTTTATTDRTTTSPPSPSKSTTTATTEVQIPAAARAHTGAGAEAYVRFFMDQVSDAWMTPKTGLIRDLGLPDCLACRSFESTAARLVSQGQRYERRPSTIISTSAVTDGTGQRVHAVIQQHEVNIVDEHGNVVSTDRQKRFSGDAKLVWEGKRWWLFDMR